MAMAPSSSGRVARKVPFIARPTGVRTEETITTSRIRTPALSLLYPLYELLECVGQLIPLLLSSCPILPQKSLYPGELGNFACHQLQLPVHLLPRQNNIINSD